MEITHVRLCPRFVGILVCYYVKMNVEAAIYLPGSQHLKIPNTMFSKLTLATFVKLST